MKFLGRVLNLRRRILAQLNRWFVQQDAKRRRRRPRIGDCFFVNLTTVQWRVLWNLHCPPRPNPNRIDPFLPVPKHSWQSVHQRQIRRIRPQRVRVPWKTSVSRLVLVIYAWTWVAYSNQIRPRPVIQIRLYGSLVGLRPWLAVGCLVLRIHGRRLCWWWSWRWAWY